MEKILFQNIQKNNIEKKNDSEIDELKKQLELVEITLKIKIYEQVLLLLQNNNKKFEEEEEEEKKEPEEPEIIKY